MSSATGIKASMGPCQSCSWYAFEQIILEIIEVGAPCGSSFLNNKFEQNGSCKIELYDLRERTRFLQK